MVVTICALMLALGFVLGLSFFALCKNELDLERRMHEMTKDTLNKLIKKNEMDKLSGGGND